MEKEKGGTLFIPTKHRKYAIHSIGVCALILSERVIKNLPERKHTPLYEKGTKQNQNKPMESTYQGLMVIFFFGILNS